MPGCSYHCDEHESSTQSKEFCDHTRIAMKMITVSPPPIYHAAIFFPRDLSPHPPSIDCCPLYSCSFCLRFCIVIGVEVGKCAIQVACSSRRPAEIPNSRVFVLFLTRAELPSRHILFRHILFSIFT